MIIQEDIEQHAEAANQWQEKCQEHQRQAASHHLEALKCAMRSGAELIQIKDKLPHGEYEGWVRSEFKGSLSTARRNKSIAEEWEWISSKIDVGEIRTIDEAREAIKERNKEQWEQYGDHESLEKVRRELFIQQLEAASPGLSPREIIEQSNMFVFKDGRIITYNDEIACSIKCGLPIDGVVQAPPLLRLLKKMDETYIKIEVDDSLLVITGRGNQAGIRLEQEIQLPIDNVPTPPYWNELPEEFLEAVKTVASCAGNDESQFVITCVHLTERYIEACDNFQLCRYWIETGLKTEMLIRTASLSEIARHDMTQIGITPDWVHFQNDKGMMMSCRYHTEKDNEKIADENEDELLYPKLDNLFKVEGKPLKLPKGLTKAVSRSTIFTEMDGDNNSVRFDLMGNSLKVSGEGAYGYYEEELDLDETAPQISFRMSPKLIAQFAKKYESCEVSEERLKVDAGSFEYVACLEGVQDSN